MADRQNLIVVEGSHGSLTVHRTSGHIVERALDGDGYADIRWFDPAGLPPYSSTDILYTSFVCERGIYTRAMETGEVHDKHGHWHMAFDVELLPPPAVSRHAWEA